MDRKIYRLRVAEACILAAIAVGTPLAFAGPVSRVDHDYDLFTRPTVLADIGQGRSISWFCVGNGSPTVVLTAGASDWSSAWRNVLSQTGRTTRACAWDRAGFGFSSPSREVQDVVHTEADLERSLTAAHISGPYVMVAHSLGAFETLRFADRNRGTVAGMVLVDPAFPDQFRVLAKRYPGVFGLQSSINAQNAHDLRGCIAGLRTGSVKPLSPAWRDYIGDDRSYPALLRNRLARLSEDPGRLPTQLSFTLTEFRDAQQIVNPHRDYGNMPLVVLTAMDAPNLPASVAPKEVAAEMKNMQRDLWMKSHDRMAGLSSRGENVAVAGSSHYVQLIRPEIVVEQIKKIVVLVRSERRSGRHRKI